MRTERTTLKRFLLATALLAVAALSFALDFPHSPTANGISCPNCHDPDSAYTKLIKVANPHTPADIDDTIFNNLCWSCHNDVVAPFRKPHSSLTTDDGYGNIVDGVNVGWNIECRTCHFPHDQQQLRHGPDAYLATGAITAITATTLTKAGAGWTPDEFAGLVLYPNVTGNRLSYRVLGNTADTLTVKTAMDLTKAAAGNTFAVIYGKLIKNVIMTPNSGPKTVKLFRPTPAAAQPNKNTFADGDGTYDGVCEVCHTKPRHHRNNNDHPEEADHTHNLGLKCTLCHQHRNGFKPIGAGSHTVHLFEEFGPKISCGEGNWGCHGVNTPGSVYPAAALFADGKPLCDMRDPGDRSSPTSGVSCPDTGPDTGTQVCANCHGEGAVKAKYYFFRPGSSRGSGGAGLVISAQSGDYTWADTWLGQGGEAAYCGSCHDNTSGTYVTGPQPPRQPPNIVGDNSTYGFFVNGHGKTTGNYSKLSWQETTATGNPAAKRICGDCHDYTKTHFNNADPNTHKRLKYWGTAEGSNKTCKQCHDNANPNAIAQSDPQWYTTYADYQNSAHGSSAKGNLECVKCHEPHGQGGVGKPAMTRELRENLCYNCHTGDSGAWMNVVNDAVSGSTLATSIEQAFNLPSGGKHPVAAYKAFQHSGKTYNLTCISCHNVHLVTGKYWEADQGKSPLTKFSNNTAVWGASAGQKMNDYAGTGKYVTPNLETFTGTQMPDYPSFCLDCHGQPDPGGWTSYGASGGIPPTSHQGINWVTDPHGKDPASRPYGEGTCPDWIKCGNAEGWYGARNGYLLDSCDDWSKCWPVIPIGRGDQSWVYPYPHQERIAGANFTLACINCHEAHGSTLSSMIRSNLNGSPLTSTGWQTLCSACHNRNTDWHAGMGCATSSCHDSQSIHRMDKNDENYATRTVDNTKVFDFAFEGDLQDSGDWRQHGKWFHYDVAPPLHVGSFAGGKYGNAAVFTLDTNVEPGTRILDYSVAWNRQTFIFTEMKFNTSMETWVYLADTSQDAYNIFAKYNNSWQEDISQGGYNFALRKIGGTYRVAFRAQVDNNGTTQDGRAGIRGAYSTVGIPANRWSHVAATFDTAGPNRDPNDPSVGRIRIYVNGVDVTTSDSSGEMMQPGAGENSMYAYIENGPWWNNGVCGDLGDEGIGFCRSTLFIGGMYNRPNKFIGRLDDARLWNAAKPASYFAAYQSAVGPYISSVEGTVGSDKLKVVFSEGVYTNTGMSGALVPSDFTLVDTDNGRTVTAVSHTAGSSEAVLTLNVVMDSANDLGTDTLAAASNAIYDKNNVAASTTPVTISAYYTCPPDPVTLNLNEASGASYVFDSLNIISGVVYGGAATLTGSEYSGGGSGSGRYIRFADNDACLQAATAMTIDARFKPAGLSGITGAYIGTILSRNGSNADNYDLLVWRNPADTTNFPGFTPPDGVASIYLGLHPDDNHGGSNWKVMMTDYTACPIQSDHWYKTKVVWNTSKPGGATGQFFVPADIYVDDQGVNGDDAGESWSGWKNCTNAAQSYNADTRKLYTGDTITAGSNDFAVGTLAYSLGTYAYNGLIDWVTWSSTGAAPFAPLVPTMGTPAALSSTSIRWNFTDNSLDEAGFRLHNAAHTYNKDVATPNLGYIDDTGLTPNTNYGRHVHAYNSAGESPASAGATRYTLGAPPNVTADKATSTWFATPDVVFTNAAGFGTGKVQYYRYAWDQSATHTFTDAETQWSTGTLTKTATVSGSWYLHVKSYNVENVGGDTHTYGPFYYDAVAPSTSALNPANGAAGVTASGNLTLTLSDGHSGVNWTTFSITLTGSKGYSRTYTDLDTTRVYKTGTSASYAITVNPDTDFSLNEVITVTVNASDSVGNALTPPAWSFNILSGAVSYWKLDETGGIAAADSVGPNTGTLANGPAWTTGKANNGLSFDGSNDYVDVGGDSSLAFERTNPFTLEMWVKFAADTGAQMSLLGNMDLTAGVYRGIRLFRSAANNLTLMLRNDSTSGNFFQVRSSTSLLSSGGWYHVVATYDGTSTAAGVKLYINGAPETTVNVADALTGTVLSGQPWTMGMWRTTNSPMQGLMDEVLVYNRVLSADEVSGRYNLDTTKPVVSSMSPANGATMVETTSNLTFTLSDSGSGVDWTSFTATIAGSNGYYRAYTATSPQVTKTGTSASYNVTVNPDVNLGNPEVITVTLTAYDMAGNAVQPFTWSFTTSDLPPGATHYWDMDEGSGQTASDSEGASDGTLGSTGGSDLNDPAWAAGKRGNALNFVAADSPTNDFVTIGNLGAMPVVGTIEFWIKPSAVDNYRNALTTRYNGLNKAIQFAEDAAGNFIVVAGNDSGGYSSSNGCGSGPDTLGVGLTANTWHHVAYSWNTTTGAQAGWWDGAPSFSNTHTCWPTTIPDFRIGTGFDETSGRQWRGLVDEVAIYNRWLTDAEITERANAVNWNISPANGATNVTVNTDLAFTVSDSQVGVDWTSVDITLTGNKGYSRHYTDLDTSIVTKTGTQASYNVTVNPDADFAYGEAITVTLNIKDLAGHTLAAPAWSFTTYADASAPAISGVNPANDSVNVALNTNLAFTLSDAGSGVDWSTFGVTLSGSKGYSASYNSASPQAGKTGTKANYAVTVNPAADFAPHEIITATASVGDYAGNVLSTIWTFTASNGLIAHWPFGEGSGSFTVDVAGTNYGYLADGPTWVAGKIGNGISFDGVDDRVVVTTPETGSPLNVTNLSIEAWSSTAAYTAGTPAGTDNRILLSRQSAGGAANGYELGVTSNGSPYLTFEDLSAQNWTKLDNTLPAASDTASTGGRIPLGSPGRGDSARAIPGSVIKDGATWKMWYSGHDGTAYRIYYATSPDGLAWTKHDNTVPPASDTAGTNGRIPLGTSGGDATGAMSPKVVKDGATYKMWYTGSDSANSRIYYATSPDGLAWTKRDNTAPPASDTVGTNGRIPLGTSGKGDSVRAYYPAVIKDGITWKMWYAGNDGTSARIYHATSPDGLTWTKYDNAVPPAYDIGGINGKIPLGNSGKGDSAHTSYPHVIKDGGAYKMWYSGHDGTRFRIYHATSYDGLTWTKYDNAIPVASDTAGANGRIPVGTAGGDSYLTFSPVVFKDGPVYRLWYGGGVDATTFDTYYASLSAGIVTPSAPSSGWRHIVGTKDAGGALRIYVNGAETASGSTPVAGVNSDAGLVMGGLLKGSVDEVYLYSRALSASEVVERTDATNPAASALSPANGATGVAITSNLTLTLADGGSGIDWSSFSMSLTGNKGYSKTYTNLDTAIVTKTGTQASYDVTVNPNTNFAYGEVIAVSVNANDLAGNPLTPPAWSFTTYWETAPPVVSSQSPANGATFVAVNSNLTFTLADTGIGVNWSTFTATLVGDHGYSKSYNSASAQVTKTGTSASYNVTINPDTDFSLDEVVTVTVNASDFIGNALTSPAWTFTTGTPPPSGVISWWRLNETSGTTASDSIGTNHGTLTNGPTWTDNALSFDGTNDYVSMAQGPNISDKFSLELWVNATQTENKLINYPISLGLGGSLRLGLYIGGTFSSSEIAARSIGIYNGTNGASTVANTFTDAADAGAWHHIVATYDASATPRTRIYKDGAEMAMYTDNISGNIPALDHVNIGRRVDGTWHWKGLIDEALVYNRALTAAEVTDRYNLDVAGPAVSALSPSNGATTVEVNSNLTFTLSDGGSGVDWSTFAITLTGNKGYSRNYTDASAQVTKTGTAASYNVTVNPDTDFGYAEVITVTVAAYDLAGNAIQISPWSFTTSSLPYGATHWWKLNETSGTNANDTVGSNDGTLTNGPTWVVGKSGNAVNFDGSNDFVTIGSLGAFPSQGTLEFWIKPSSIANYRNPMTTKYNGSNAGIRFEENAAGDFTVTAGNDGGGYRPVDGCTTGPDTFVSGGMTAGAWYHVVYSWNTATGSQKGYLNGAPVFNNTHTCWPTTIPDMRLGTGFNADAARQWQGLIDEVVMYNRQLTNAEVTDRYNNP